MGKRPLKKQQIETQYLGKSHVSENGRKGQGHMKMTNEVIQRQPLVPKAMSCCRLVHLHGRDEADSATNSVKDTLSGPPRAIAQGTRVELHGFDKTC